MRVFLADTEAVPFLDVLFWLPYLFGTALAVLA
jgi:hypothetical protein